MMTKEEIYTELKNVLVQSFMIDADDISPEADLYADLDFDSIDAIDLAAKIHNVTGQQMKPEQFKGVRTIGDAVNVIDELLRAK
ncbi:acyl carrier protein [Gilvimarinus xylanilyticus]|uniref:Acyl carrier protein n=1 Tax=Gilvimarinus xylanilyticus TaxID=2944139 RepID=A0A9X2KX06_9GAMM|nr:acyl carrier protein [Gilvimarinus xylanilyticus]MCP8900135.1 acyl carrier protein [Gilvimarinus xylanilyticus]